MQSIDSAPESPGLYAWYIEFQAGRRDWEMRVEDGKDSAVSGFSEILRRYEAQHEDVPIDLGGRSSYDTVWTGSLRKLEKAAQGDNDSDTVAEEVLDGNFDQINEPRPGVGSVDSEGKRQLYTNLLRSAIPVFAAPAYIGVTDNLKKRLITHRRDFTRASEWIRDHPGDAERMRSSGKTFGSRAAARGIALENLTVWVLDAAEIDSQATDTQLRQVSGSAEHLLHKIFAPVLGRR